MSKHGSLICQDSHPFAHLGRVRRYWRTYRDALTVGKPAACLRLVLNRRSFFAGEQRASNRDGKSRRAARHTRFLITCPLSSTLDLGRSSKPDILSSVSSSRRQMTSSTAPSQSGKLSTDPHVRCPADDAETVEHAYARRTLHHCPSPPRRSRPTLRMLTPRHKMTAENG